MLCDSFRNRGTERMNIHQHIETDVTAVREAAGRRRPQPLGRLARAGP